MLRVGTLLFIAVSLAPCQNILSTQTGQESRHLFWIIPNYRTSASLHPYTPLTVKEKFKVAGEDSWDRGTLALAALFAGEAQLGNSNRPFGQGVAGYARYWGTSYGTL